MKIDEEFKNLIPPLSSEEYSQLEQNCIDYGIRDALIVTALPGETDIVLIDGHNRYEIAKKNNLAYNVKRFDFQDREAVKEWIIKNQLGRRNIPPYVRAELALKLKPVIAAKAKERQGARNDLKDIPQKSAGSETRDELAKAAGVSHDTIHKVEKIQEKAPEEVKAALRKGEMSINQVYGWIAKEEHPDKYQKAAKEYREAIKRNDEFEEQKAEGIVDLADAKQNKSDRAKLFEAFKATFNEMTYQIRHMGAMANDGIYQKKLAMGDKREAVRISEHLSECYRTILKLQRITEEVIDEQF